jgi:hypothetical protein
MWCARLSTGPWALLLGIESSKLNRTMESPIKIVSFNMHGFGQGVCSLTELCKDVDIVFYKNTGLVRMI